MATNLALDPKLVADAVAVGGHKTKKQAVTAALEDYIRYRKQLAIIELFGTVDYDEDYDIRAERIKSTSRVLFDADDS